MNVPAMQRLIAELRNSGISDEAVLAAIGAVDRERFVSPTFAERAWDNTALPISFGQTISQPLVVAAMTEALRVGPRMKVLEIGTGSGYQAAVLSRICRRVYTIERFKELLQIAEARFLQLRLHNITTRHGDGWKGWREQAPFERIMVTAAAASVPGALVDQLAEGGIMVLPVGQTSRDQALLRLTRTPEGVREEHLSEVRFVPLVAGVPPEAPKLAQGGGGVA